MATKNDSHLYSLHKPDRTLASITASTTAPRITNSTTSRLPRNAFSAKINSTSRKTLFPYFEIHSFSTRRRYSTWKRVVSHITELFNDSNTTPKRVTGSSSCQGQSNKNESQSHQNTASGRLKSHRERPPRLQYISKIWQKPYVVQQRKPHRIVSVGHRENTGPLIIFTQENYGREPSIANAVEKFPEQFPLRNRPRPTRMKSFVQFLTTPTADTPGTALLLHFDDKRYIIGNVHEGLQRAIVQMGTRVGKVGEIFMTGRTEWRNMGGLIGMILALADSAIASSKSQEEAWEKARLRKLQKDQANGRLIEGGGADDGNKKSTQATPGLRLTLFGPPNLNHLLATARRFVFRKGLPLEAIEFDHQSRKEGTKEWPPSWEDERVRVWAMPILPEESNQPPAAKMSPRKRSFSEVEGYDINGSAALTSEDSADRKRIAQGVVADMFSSSWSLDALFEAKLSQVYLPATLFVRDPDSKVIKKYTGPLPGSSDELPDITVLVRKPWPGAMVRSLPRTTPAKEAVSYIFRCHNQRGRFKPAEAAKLGVEKYDYSRLARGETVVSKTGQTVTPDMILEPERAGSGVAVVDLPTLEYVEPLISREEWKSEVMSGVDAVVWMLGRDVCQSEELRSFMAEFKNLQHFVSSPDLSTNQIALDSVASTTTHLSQMDPDRYNPPLHASQPTSQHLGNLPLQNQNPHIRVPKRGEVWNLMPETILSTDLIVPALDIDAVKNNIPEEVLSLASEASKYLESDKAGLDVWAETLPSKDTEIIALGTGSALPSKYRNVSATLVRIPGYGSVLFDCGENTLGQLQRVYSPTELSQVLQELKIIWISHMHADHHLGTVSVIRAWYHEVHGAQPDTMEESSYSEPHMRMKDKRLAVVSENAMLQWLHEYSAVEDYGYSRLAPLCISAALPSKHVASNLQWYSTASDPKVDVDAAGFSQTPSLPQLHRRETSVLIPPSALNLASIQAVAVKHCKGARAVSITFPSGLKISYSGDCRPSRNFARIGQESHVLIHEATFDDELKGDANAKNHSTTREALKVGAWMRAKAVVLTHFSQRYQKVPVLDGLDEEMTKDEPREEETVVDEDDHAPIEPQPTSSTFQSLADIGKPAEPKDAPLPGASELTTSTHGSDDIFEDKQALKDAARNLKVAIAFDYMRLRIGDIAKMSYFTSALRRLYAEEERDEKASRPSSANGDSSKNTNNGQPKKSKAEKKKAKKAEAAEAAKASKQ
ncbi:MAG: hypothetical protein M1820_002177 [Bogoriella megaspora]|nr:MAG: hypothetical protein M1820_002177 [Bogoriella megaspora]